MRVFHIEGQREVSKIYVGEKLKNLTKYIPTGKKTMVITDVNVQRLYSEQFASYRTVVIGTTEKVKTLQTVMEIAQQLLDLGADRNTFLVGIGGGLVTDITGFVAAVFMRGIRFGFVSSTLLAQVDASVGGKNGVNLNSYKNLIGVFRQPEFVICDTDLLDTLIPRELSSGFAEIVKHTLIRDAAMFEFLEKEATKALNLDKQTIETLVFNSVEIKADVVNQDEREAGERRKLNFGHTFGHGIEAVHHLAHGEAISLGIVIAAELSVQRGYLTLEEKERIIKVLDSLNLPTKFEVDEKAVFNALLKDKKRYNDFVYFILLKGIGNAVIEKIPVGELEQVPINEILSSIPTPNG